MNINILEKATRMALRGGNVESEAMLFRIIRGSFQMRRKQLLNTLEAALDLPKETIERLARRAHVDPRRRGETLTLDEFAKLANAAMDDA